jgi:hypothetical protein
MDIIDFQARLSARLAADAAYAKRMERIGPLQDVLARVIRKMGDLGVSDSDVAGVLRHAADVLAEAKTGASGS